MSSRDGSESKRSISLLRQLLFSALVPLLLLLLAELLLRGGGVLYLTLHRGAADALADSQTSVELWGFGDSYTLGVGAETPESQSYPAVAARLLGEQLGRQVRLSNHARPGQNSTDTVRSLEAALASAEAPPELVVFLAGVNNIRWLGQSGQFCLDEPGDSSAPLPGWLAELRLYKVLRHGVLAVRPPRREDRACMAIAEGFGFLDDGMPDRAEAAFERALESNPESRWARLGKGVALLRVGWHEEAVSFLREAQSLGLSPPALRLALAFSLRAQGQGAAALAAVEAERGGELAEFVELLQAWTVYDQGKYEEALARFRRLSPRAGEENMAPGAVTIYGLDGEGWALRGLGRAEEAAPAFDEANRRGREMFVTPHLLGWAHLGRALLAAEAGDLGAAQRELGEAVRDSSAAATALAVEGWLAGMQGCSEAHAHFAASLAIVPWQEQALVGQRLCAQLGDAGRLSHWQEVDGFPAWRPQPTVSIQQWLDPGDTRLVEADLATVCAQVGAVGSSLVLLTYPQPDAHPDLAAAILRAGLRCGVPVVDPRALFRTALDDGVPWSALLVADGHPTARGYAMIGEQLVETLLAELGVSRAQSSPPQQGGEAPQREATSPKVGAGSLDPR